MRVWTAKISVMVALMAAAPVDAQDEQLEQEQQDQQAEQDLEPEPASQGNRTAKTKSRSPGGRHSRPYQVVLNRVLEAFSADAYLGPIRQLERYAIRRISLSEHIPRLHARYIQTAFIEKLMKASKGQLVVCPPCSQRTALLAEGKLMITSPASNAAQIDKAAEDLGIKQFVEAVFMFERTHIALAVQVIDAKTNTLLWSKAYDSELLNQDLATRDAAIAVSRGRETYVPEFSYTAAFGGAGIPNIGGTEQDSQMLALRLTAMESFARKAHRFGLALSYYRATRAMLKEYPAETPSADASSASTKEKIIKPIAKPFTRAMTAHAMYSRLLFGDAEHRDQPRVFAEAGLGAIAANGYIAPAGRLGLDTYFGRMFATSLGVHYFLPTNVRIEGELQRTAGGAGGEFLMGLSF